MRIYLENIHYYTKLCHENYSFTKNGKRNILAITFADKLNHVYHVYIMVEVFV